MVVATASYYLVEQPVRRGRMATFAEWRGWLVMSGAFLGVVAVTVTATLPSAAEAAGTYRANVTATPGAPVRMAILGDSVAWRLGFALLAAQPQQTYGVDIDNGAIVACGVVRSSQYRAQHDGLPMQLVGTGFEPVAGPMAGHYRPIPAERSGRARRPLGGHGPHGCGSVGTYRPTDL
jgi:hypothetical protein